MNISSLKDLKKLLVLCRQQGVQSIKLGEVEFHLGSLPTKQKRMAEVDDAFPEAQIQVPKFTPVITNQAVAETVADVIATDGLTDEQLLMWSAQGNIDEAM